MNHSKLFTVISKLFTTSKTKKKSIAISSMQQARQVILSIFLFIVFSTAVLKSTNDVGTLDSSFGSGGSLNLAGVVPGTGYRAIAVQPLTDGSFLVLLDKDTVSYLAKFSAQGVIDTSFGDVESGSLRTGYCTLYPLSKLGDFSYCAQPTIMIDAYGRYILTGNTNINKYRPWIIRITTDGIIDTSFAWDDEPAWYNWDIIGMAQTSSGKIIACGINSDTVAMIARYNTDGTIDITFGVNGYVIDEAIQVFQSCVIDTSDNIYVVIKANNSGNIFIRRYTAAGALDTNWASSGQAAVTALNGANIWQGMCMAFNLDGNLIVAGQVNNNIVVTAIQSTDGGTVSGFTDYTTSGGDSYSVFNILTTTNGSIGKIYIIGTDLTTSKSDVIRLNGDGTLDTSGFNATLGYNQFSIGTPIISSLYGSGIASDSSLYVVGYQVESDVTVPYISRLHNNISTIQVPQYPVQSLAGTLDTTFGTNGTLEVPGGLTIHPMSMQIISNTGDIILGINHDTTSNLAGLTSAFALDTTDFGVVETMSGSTTGITAPLPANLVNIRQIMTDHAGDLYVVGDNGTQASIVKLTADGSAIVWHTETPNIISALCVVEQASGRILIGGNHYNGTSQYGIIVAYDPNNGAVDTSFNQGSVNPGYYFTVYNNPVTSLSVVDGTDKILFTYANYDTGVNHKVQLNRLLENGAFDTDLTLSGTPINSFTDNNTIKMQQDVNNKIVVVASVGDGFMASRYNADGSNNVINTHIVVDTVHVGSSSLKNILCLSDGTTLILGTNTYSGSTDLVLAKLKSDFTLDTTFNSAGTVPGVLNTVVTTFNTTTMTNFYALGMSTVAPYDILVAGDDGTNPYVIGIISGLSSAVTPTNQSTTTWGLPGTLDTTYNAGHNDSHEAGFFDLGNEIDPGFAGESVQAMLQNSDGSYFVVSSWITPGYGYDSFIMKFNSDDTKNITFGAGTFVTISGMATAHDMIMMQNGNLLIVGETSESYCRIVSLNPSTGEVLHDISWGKFFYNNAVAQQSNGRLIFSGAWLEADETTKTPALLAFNPLTFEMDFTFGEGGIYRDPALSITTPQGIGDMTIDSDDNIYFVIQYNIFGNPVGVYKLSNTGAGPVLWTGNQGIPSLGDSRYNKIACDQNSDLIVASSGSGGLNQFINVYRFNSVTGIPSQTNSFAYATTGITYPLVSGLMIDQTSPTGNIILCGHNGTSPDNPFVMRVLSDLSAVDTTFNAAPAAKPGVQPIAVTTPASSGGSWGAGFISANGKITVGGYAIFSSSNKPYLMRLYGNDFIGEYSQAIDAGVPGTLNLGFGTNGYFGLSDISTDNTVNPVVVLPMVDGYQYIAFNDGTLVRLTNGNELDETYGSQTPTPTGFATDAPAGVTSMIMDANGCLVLVGTSSDYGWIVRYAAGDSGLYDSTFNNGAVFYFEQNSIATCVVEQTLSRLVVGGQRLDGNTGDVNGILWAMTNTGALDVTFNANNTPGNYVNNNLGLISSLVADQYDRLIFTCTGLGGYTVDIYLVRVTASGEYDRYTQISVFDDNSEPTQIRVCFDVDGNIVVAAQTDTGLSVIAYDSDFNVVETVLTLPDESLTLTGLIACADGKILISGFVESGTFVIRVQDDGANSYELDPTFNPEENPGIMLLTSLINITSIAIYGDGELTIGAGTIGGPYLLRAYDNPYTSQEAICQYALPVGTNDQTFGVTTNVTNGITFFATQYATDDTGLQIAQAIALPDDQNILVAINSQINEESPSIIVLNMFDVDGLLNTHFNEDAQTPCDPGQAIVLDAFDNQYVQDMMTFTVDGVQKAILAGYSTNNALQVSNSLLIQFDLGSAVLDDAFGGFNGDPEGVAMGNGPSQAFTLGRQSMGRIIVGGATMNMGQASSGLLQAYTASGLLDQSFGQDGYFTQGDTGIYSAVIDSQDRVVCLYTDGTGGMTLARILADGSGLDQTFNAGETPGTYNVTYATGEELYNNSYRIAIDQLDNVFVSQVVTDLSSSGVLSIWMTILGSDGTLSSTVQLPASTFGGLTNFTITKLLMTPPTTSGNVYAAIVGYDQVISGNQIMVVSLVNDGSGWALNEEGFNYEETSGYIKYAVGVSSWQTSAGAIIHPDGRVIIAGSVDNNIPG